MDRIYLETLACAGIVCMFYAIVWWLLGSYFFGLANPILIAAVVIFAIADICAIHYLIRRRARKSQNSSGTE